MQSQVLSRPHCQAAPAARPSTRHACKTLRLTSVISNCPSKGLAKKAQSSSSSPPPAETARTIVDLCSEASLATLSENNVPFATPISYSLNKQGQVFLDLQPGSLELRHLKRNPRCSMLVQSTTFPIRAVAAVTLVGAVKSQSEEAGSGAAAGSKMLLDVEKCVFMGGLHLSGQVCDVSGADFRAAEPDTLRKDAVELINVWNSDRAEDVYRIVSSFLGVPLTQMGYAELLWIDRLGMYIRAEVESQPPSVVRVPFPRPVNDERDARSVITMAAQVAWEKEKTYQPSVPSIFASLANNN